jgi:hypothetical protein
MEDKIIKVNELIKNRESVEDADILISEIMNCNESIIQIDWENSGGISIAFFDRLLNYLKTSKKNIIDLNLSEHEKEIIRSFMVDSEEKKYFQ